VPFRSAPEHFGLAFRKLLGCGIFDMRGDPPAKSKRILHVAVPVAPKLISDRHNHRAAGGYGLRENGVGISHVQMECKWPISLRDWRSAKLRKVIIEHQVGIADADMRMHQLASGSGRSRNFDRVECTFKEIDVLRRPRYGDMRCKRTEPFRNRIFCFGHSATIVGQLAYHSKEDMGAMESDPLSPTEEADFLGCGFAYDGCCVVRAEPRDFKSLSRELAHNARVTGVM